MLNQLTLVGRIIRSGKDDAGSIITIKVPRAYKNEEGIYEVDIFDIHILADNMMKNVAEYCKEGDLIGIKGRLQMYKYESDGKKMRKTLILAEKITFLSSAAKEPGSVNDEESDED